ncbi:vWA domain-containing protein [Hartmannibacter diazotrophicus]|nr:VWA domain-containing protein [Hartmannibacter diazotrophicus]
MTTQTKLMLGGAAASVMLLPLILLPLVKTDILSMPGAPSPMLADEQELPSARKDAAKVAEGQLAPPPPVENDMAVVQSAEPLIEAPIPADPQQAAGAAARLRREAAPIMSELMAQKPLAMPAPSTMPTVGDAMMPPEASRDRFEAADTNPVNVTAEDPVSTFSIDTDTASYAFVRRMIEAGRMPPPDAVRVEEMINYFPYDYALPESRETPFQPTVAVYPTPWNAATKIVHIGIKGYDVQPAVRPKANLVFLIDVSGSMNAPDKLPLVKASLKLLLGKLSPDDHVSLVTYAGAAGVALEPTAASDKPAILKAIDGLGAGGSTAGAAGLDEAYALAQKSFDAKGVNRVILATDGDFNVGASDDDSLTRLIEQKRESGIFLSVLGFGEGNYNDALMQRLAQNGNGAAAYIDKLAEAQKVLVDEATSTLFPVAKDVKIQVEFNPQAIAEYRLIGYETRTLSRTDFNNDKVDAGEVGAGTAVTALYEITPAGSPARLADDLRYQSSGQGASATADGTLHANEYGFLKIRYKLPDEDKSRLIETPITTANEAADIDGVSDDMRFAAAVAAFGQKLKANPAVADMGYDRIADLAVDARGADAYGYRSGFVSLVRLAGALAGK